MILRAAILLGLLAAPVRAGTCEEQVERLAKPVELVVGDDHRLHFQVMGGKSPMTRAAGHVMTAMAKPFWLKKMSDVLEQVARDERPLNLYDKMLSALKIDYRTQGLDLESIPKTGPLLVVANHPRFGVEGLAIASAISRVRPDLRLTPNEMMMTVPGFEEISFPIEKDGGNQKSFRGMQNWLRQGHVVMIFPAGGVSGFQREVGRIEDKPWSRSIIILAQSTGATMLPIHSSPADPGISFRTMDRLGSGAQKSTYPQEILRQSGQTVDLTLGQLLPASDFQGISEREEAAQLIREYVYGIAGDHPLYPLNCDIP